VRSNAGKPTAALSAAAELQHVALVDALELVLLLRDEDPARYGRRSQVNEGMACEMVRCEECGCVASDPDEGWVWYLIDDEEEPDQDWYFGPLSAGTLDTEPARCQP